MKLHEEHHQLVPTSITYDKHVMDRLRRRIRSRIKLPAVNCVQQSSLSQ